MTIRYGVFFAPEETKQVNTFVQALMTGWSNDTLGQLQTYIYQIAVNFHNMPDNGNPFYGLDLTTGEIISGDN
ncbi:MAG: hypothetical protein C5B59_17295 [Bacteroidetes bacterium]|nr:MAG: hypothetical protein C5B59_17295 [Bacteroidota bacterium]